jgi:hypothetical protein
MAFNAGSPSRNPGGGAGADARETIATFFDHGRAYQLDLERVQLRPNYLVCSSHRAVSASFRGYTG